jgi:hypothetical protein
MKKKKNVCGGVLVDFARVGVQREVADGCRVVGSQVAKFVEPVCSPLARGGGHHQEKFAMEIVDEENLDTQADFCWQ